MRVSDENSSVYVSGLEEWFSHLLLSLCDELGSFQGFNHSLVSLTIVPVPNFTILFGLTSTLSSICLYFFPLLRYVPFLLFISFSISLAASIVSSACFLDTSWAGITTTF